jgi:hypothetical protein
MSTKRTTARIAIDVDGNVIRLLKTRLTSSRGYNTLRYNTLLYTEVRRAVKTNDTSVSVLTGNKSLVGYENPMDIRRTFGQVTDATFLEGNELDAYNEGPVFSIGYHTFTLKMFNRILRAAGVRTTKATTLKAFAARA